MPHWASRITLEITSVRVERIQGISEADCDAEGFGGAFPHLPACSYPMVTDLPGNCRCPDFTLPEIFAQHWNLLNEKRGYGWEKNPWVWVIEFRRVQADAERVA